MNNCKQYEGSANQLWLSAGVAAVAGAACAGVAVGLNAGFFTAVGAPALCVAASVFFFYAVGVLEASIAELDKYAACVRLSQTCQGHFDNLRRTIQALVVDLGIAGGTALGVAAAAWIPWFSGPAIVALLVAALVLCGLIVSMVAFAVQFFACTESLQAADGTTGSSSGGLTEEPVTDGDSASDQPAPLRVRIVAVEGKVRLPKDKVQVGTKPGKVITPNGGTLLMPCPIFETKRWEIWAGANVSGAVGAVTFEWWWDQNPPPGGPANAPQVRFEVSSDANVLPDFSAVHVLSVTVRDSSGRSASANFSIETPMRYSVCTGTLAPFAAAEMNRFLDALKKPAMVPSLAWKLALRQVRGRAMELAPDLDARISGASASQSCGCSDLKPDVVAAPWVQASADLARAVEREKVKT